MRPGISLCAQLSHKPKQISARVTLFAGRPAGCWQAGEEQVEQINGLADFGYDCRLINAIRNNKQ